MPAILVASQKMKPGMKSGLPKLKTRAAHGSQPRTRPALQVTRVGTAPPASPQTPKTPQKQAGRLSLIPTKVPPVVQRESKGGTQGGIHGELQGETPGLDMGGSQQQELDKGDEVEKDVGLRLEKGLKLVSDADTESEAVILFADSEKDPKIYTDWANHYLVKSGHQRLITDLQQDLNDGVLLAQLIQVVANEKIADIDGFPKSKTQMIQNIDVCLGFLAAKGVNIQGLCSEEIRRGNLPSILGLFFSLSRYKQQQQQQQQQQRLQRQSSLPGSPAHLFQPQGPCSRPPSPHHTCCPAPAHWSSSTEHLASHPSQTSAQAAGSKVPLFQRRPSRLPARTMRVPAGLVADVRTGSPSSPSSFSSSSSSKRRSQSFSHYDKPRPYLHAADCLDRARSTTASPVPMEGSLSPAPSLSLSPSASSIPQPLAGTGSKSWRGKSLSAKRSVTPAVLSVSPPPQPRGLEAAPKAGGQRSMLEKLKLFNSGKSASRNSAGTQTESQAEAERRGSGGRKAERKAEKKGEKRGEKKKGGKRSASGSPLAEASSENLRSAGSSTPTPSPSPSPPCPSPSPPSRSPTATSPKLALRGIAQRTLGRALTPRKSFARQADKDKTRPKDKERSGAREKEQGGQRSRASELIETESVDVEPRQEWNGSEAEPSRRGNSKGSSLIPKGSNASTAKRDIPSPTPYAAAVPAPSGIPKPGSRRARDPAVPPADREPERLGSGRGGALSVHRGPPDSPASSSCSSLASSEGRCTSHGSSGSAPLVAGTGTAAGGLAGVHLPRPALQQHSHPNTATVAPFMYRSQPDVSPGAGLTEEWPQECQSRRPATLSQSTHGSLEDLTAEDAETRRLRTVKNIADLRQNLEETMSCLRGTQVNHNSLEATGDGSVTMDTATGGRGLPSPCTRPCSTVPWRLSSTSGPPRLQAGDAPSSGTGFPVPVLTNRAVSPEGGRYLRRQTPAGQDGRMDKVEEVTDVTMETEGYASDVDDLGKGLRMDMLTSGYLTDSGVGVFSPRRLTHLHGDSGMIAPGIRQNPYRSPPKGLEDHDSWDDSSSVSSGISDTFDADDIAGSSVPCRDPHLEGGKLRTDTEKQVVRHSDLSGSDSGVKMESGSRWGCRQPSDHSDESERSSSGRKTPTVGHTGSWRRGMSAQVGVTAPRTKPSNASSSSSTLPSTSKTLGTGKTDDAKVSERGGLSPGSRSNGLQRSPSSGVDEPRKPSCGSGSSSARTPTSTFGFKKHSAAGGAGGGGSLMTLVTASGGTITSGSATLGKIPRSSLTGSLQYSNGAGPGRALSRQASVDDGYLSANGKHSALQYRSLPRPSRSSGGHTGIGTNGRSGAARGSMAGVDVSLGARAATIHGSKRNGVSQASLGANQTDREKGVAVESCAQGEVHSAGMPAGSLPPSGPRQAGGKYPDVSSPTLRRLFGGAKSAKQAPLAGPDGMKSSVVLSNPHVGPGHQGSALHSPSPSASSGASSPLYGGGRVAGLGVELGLSPLASSPGSALSTPSHSLAWSSGYPSPGYPSPGCFPSSLGSLATSSESMDVSLGSVGGGGVGPGLGGVSREDTALQTRANGVKAGYSDSPLSSPSASPKLGRNTLPRKQDRYAHLSPLRGEEPRDWLRSHSTGGVQESAACSPFSPSSSLSSPSGTRYNFTQLAGSPTTAANQMSLANLRVSAVAASGLAPQDGGEAYSDARLRNSNMSLEEKSRTISTSGSFRDGLEEVHGSSLSLVSSISSVYSTPEEKSQSEIRKLRRELEASQEKVSALTTQLSANAHLVAAFEQSLSNMTIRLHSLTTTAEQKDGELNTLKKTIDSLKRQHSVTQAAINTAINTPETCAQDPNSPVSGQASPVSPLSEACIRRQPSSDSMASLTSQTSHSSLGSANDLHSNGSKKKQKKNWLRSSFKQAFGKKKSSKASSQSDMEDSLADLSLPSSPQLSYQPRHQATSPKSSYQHHPSSPTSPGLRSSHSNSLISECVTDGASDAETVMQLRSELRDKEMKLTDIRLEALSSAHQLDTLREAMSRMQGEMDALKQENSQLRVEAQQQSQPLGQPQQAQPRLQDSSNSSSRVGPPPSVISPTLGQTAPSLTHTESTSLDMLLEDSGDSGSRKDGRHVKVVVTLDPSNNWTEECRPRQFLIGCIGVSGKTRWDVLDGVVRRLFKEYIIHVDPSSQLGLNSDSVLGYSIGEIQRRAGTHTPELLPCGYLVGHSNTISVSLKDSTCHSEDSLVFETLIPRSIVQRYISQLQEHRRIILSGPSGTGKSYLASRLAEHMVQREGLEVTPGVIATFNVDHESSKELRQYLCNLADQFSQTADMLPLVVILENLHHLPSLTDLFNGLLHGKNHRCPYIIGTMIQASSSTPNLQLHQNFRWVLCSHHVEPVKGFLGRFLRRTLLETEMSSRCRSAELVKVVDWLPSVWQHLNRFLERHSSPDVAIGPRLFLSCPMAVEASRVWFTDLWNYSLIPYLLEAVREGLQLYGRRAEWDNPTSWVLDSFPWSSSPAHPDWPPLLQLRPEDIGFHGYPITRDGCADTNTIQTDTDTDPLMNMLLRLKEAAHTPEPQSSYHSNAAQPSPESSL